MSPPKPRRRWLQFRLRTLLIAVTLVALLLGYVAWEREQCRRGRQALNMLVQKPPGEYSWPTSDRPGWLKYLLGDNQFRYSKSAALDG